jgi:serine/threonine protein kinase
MLHVEKKIRLFSNSLVCSTDVWALGCCLYSMAFLQNCFEEGSNLAILSRNYKIPEDDNPYGEGLVELIDRMLTVDCKARGDMTEVILCLSAIYSGRPLPPRKKAPKAKKKEEETGADGEEVEDEGERVGTYRTDGQGIQEKKKKKKKENPSEVSLRVFPSLDCFGVDLIFRYRVRSCLWILLLHDECGVEWEIEAHLHVRPQLAVQICLTPRSRPLLVEKSLLSTRSLHSQLIRLTLLRRGPKVEGVPLQVLMEVNNVKTERMVLMPLEAQGGQVQKQQRN